MASQKRKIKTPVAQTANSSQAHATNAEESKFVTSDEVLVRLTLESVRSRVRHRALVKTLREGDFDWDRYTANIEYVEDRDAGALFDLIVLKWDVFAERYQEWMNDDFAAYGFRRERHDHPQKQDNVPPSDVDQ